MKEVIEAWSRFVLDKLQTRHAVFCCDRKRDLFFTDSCITRLSTSCLDRLLFATFIFTPLLTWTKCCCVCLSRQLHFLSCHTARSKFLKDFSPHFGGENSRIYIWGAWSCRLVASINGIAHKRSILKSFFCIFGTFHCSSAPPCVCHHFLALYVEAAPLPLYPEPVFNITLHFIWKLLNSIYFYFLKEWHYLYFSYVVYFNINILIQLGIDKAKSVLFWS